MAKPVTKKDTKVVEAPVVEDTKVVEALVVEPVATTKPGAVVVLNRAKQRFVQPSSKTEIYPGQEKPMTNDGWLANQISAGFLEIVK